MQTLPIYNSEGKEIDSIKLDAKVFDGAVNKGSLHQAVCAFLANQRLGLASTKTRGEVSGGGRKPWKQKGTGRARVGSTRSPLWRHGGVIFGPHPRDFSFKLSQRIKSLALKSSLNIKIKENDFIVVDNFKIDKAKAKDALKLLANLKVIPRADKRKSNVLLVLDKIDNNLKLALRNIDFLDINLAKDTHAYEVLTAKKIIVTKEALETLVNRLN